MSIPYADWNQLWTRCRDCGARFKHGEKDNHYRFVCTSSPVANKISISELATQVGRSRQTVWSWVKRYKLKTTLYRKCSWIATDEYDRLLRECPQLIARKALREIGHACAAADSK